MTDESSRQPWSPGAQAEWDQLHATAIEKLRGSNTFVLAYLRVLDDGVEASVIGGNCETDLHARLLFTLLEDSVGAMRATYTGEDEA